MHALIILQFKEKQNIQLNSLLKCFYKHDLIKLKNRNKAYIYKHLKFKSASN